MRVPATPKVFEVHESKSGDRVTVLLYAGDGSEVKKSVLRALSDNLKGYLARDFPEGFSGQGVEFEQDGAREPGVVDVPNHHEVEPEPLVSRDQVPVRQEAEPVLGIAEPYDILDFSDDDGVLNRGYALVDLFEAGQQAPILFSQFAKEFALRDFADHLSAVLLRHGPDLSRDRGVPTTEPPIQDRDPDGQAYECQYHGRNGCRK